nr:iron chelate uptake ABC transporter family permease subunit [Nesterenkonia lutea]
MSAQTTSARAIAASRRVRSRRRLTVILVLSLLALTVYLLSLTVGRTFYPLTDVIQVALGADVEGANFTIGTIRLPRATLAVLVGFCFGLAGVTFQTMLRNPLASPDIIGISSGASAAAAIAIIFFSASGATVSLVAISAGLAVALLIYLLAYRDGVSGTRLILIGIGITAMLESLIAYALSQAAEWDLQAAMRWLAGSLNGASWEATIPVALALLVLGPILLGQAKNIGALQLGDDTASALGVRVERTRLSLILCAVGLIAFATAAAGPIAFVAFLSGPIAARLIGPNGSLLLPSALVGTLLVLVADFTGQYLFGTRYPVGVVTGVLGAPYLVYLIVRANRSGGSI